MSVIDGHGYLIPYLHGVLTITITMIHSLPEGGFLEAQAGAVLGGLSRHPHRWPAGGS